MLSFLIKYKTEYLGDQKQQGFYLKTPMLAQKLLILKF